jgi:hypothetical protein
VSYHQGNLPPPFEPPACVEPLDAKRFMMLLTDFVDAVADGNAKLERAALADAVDELFRRLAT